MIRLRKDEACTADLGLGVAVTHRPVRSVDVWVAQQMAALAEPDRRRVVLVQSIARAVITAVAGVEDADGFPASASPETIDALMDLWPLYNAFEARVVGPALVLDAEKNG